MDRRPSRSDIFARDMVAAILERGVEMRNEVVKSGLQQLDILSRHAQPVAYHGGGVTYGGSLYGGYRSSGAGWPHGLSNGGRSRTLKHQAMRLNARDAYHDSPQARAIVDRFADTVADVALVRESSPRASVLGITAEMAKEWARDLDIRFDLYCRDKKQHRSETLTLYEAQHLYQIFQHRDNDIFKRLYYSSDRGLQNPLQWEFIDPDQIQGQGFTGTYGEYMDNMFDGIERDERGREKAYRVHVRDGEGKFKSVTVQRKGPKSGRLFMLHGFRPEYAGQGRGYSRIGFALQSLENITDFKSAHIKKAINQSSIVFTVKNKDFDPTHLFEGGMTTFGRGAAAQQFGGTPTPSDDAKNVGIEPITCYQKPEFTLDTPGSTVFMNGGQGDEITPFAPNAPHDSFDKFVDAFMYYLSAAAGIPLEVVLMRFNQNYSASRGTLILFWRTVMIWREEWAADCGNVIFEMWLAGEIAAGRVRAPGWSDPVLRAAWLHGTWRGAPLPDIDPSKTAKARRENLSLGLTTMEREASDLNGSDAETNRAQLAHEYGERVPPPWETRALSGNQETDAQAQAIAEIAAEIAIEELREDR